MLGNWGNKEAGKPDPSDSTVNETLKFCKSSALFFFFFFPMAVPAAYGSSGLRVESELHLRPKL